MFDSWATWCSTCGIAEGTLLRVCIFQLTRLFSQEAFMEQYFESQRDNIFRFVEVLIYVFDVESKDPKDMHYFKLCVDTIRQNSPGAKIFCLIHKMDLLPETARPIVPLSFSPANLVFSNANKI